jgi:hypothetical protein
VRAVSPKKDKYREDDDEAETPQFVITTDRPKRFENPPANRTSNRQSSAMHYYHKMETPLINEPSPSTSPTGAVKIAAFQPKKRFRYSLSPEHMVPPVHSVAETTKPIQVVKVVQEAPRELSPTYKEFSIK